MVCYMSVTVGTVGYTIGWKQPLVVGWMRESKFVDSPVSQGSIQILNVCNFMYCKRIGKCNRLFFPIPLGAGNTTLLVSLQISILKAILTPSCKKNYICF